MSTLDKSIIDKVINGEYDDDNPVRIVEYTNAFGALSYGLTFKGEDHDKYMKQSEYIINPKIYWEAK